MSIAHVGSLGSAGIGASASVTLTTSAVCEVGNLVVVEVCKDNVGIVNNTNANEVTGVTDSAGNDWSAGKAYEYTRTGGIAGDGTVVAVFFCRVTAQIDSGGTITAAFSASVAGSCIRANEFTVSGNVALFGTPQAATSTGTACGSLALSGLASQEYLFVRAVGWDNTAYTLSTITGGFTTLGNSIAGTGQRVGGEFLISTGTGATSAPSISFAANNASAFIAIGETSAPAVATQGLFMGMM